MTLPRSWAPPEARERIDLGASWMASALTRPPRPTRPGAGADPPREQLQVGAGEARSTRAAVLRLLAVAALGSLEEVGDVLRQEAGFREPRRTCSVWERKYRPSPRRGFFQVSIVFGSNPHASNTLQPSASMEIRDQRVQVRVTRRTLANRQRADLLDAHRRVLHLCGAVATGVVSAMEDRRRWSEEPLRQPGARWPSTARPCAPG
jgi:hypothetical protein